MPANPFSGGKIAALTERIRVQTRQQLIDITRQRTAENQAALRAVFGSEAPIERWVDGALGKPLEQAQQVTLTEFSTLQFVVDAALAALIQASPYGQEREGHYRDDHWLYVNGTRRSAAAEGAAVPIEQTDQIVILNPRPYAARIEGGTPGRYKGQMVARRPGLSVQAPDGVYEITAKALRLRFGRIAKIAFAWRRPAGPAETQAGTGRGPFPALEISAVL